MYKTKPKHVISIGVISVMAMLISVLFGSCSPKISSTITKVKETTLIKETLRDSLVSVKADSAQVVRDLAAGLTEPQKKVAYSFDMPSDTVKKGNFKIITSIHKGKLSTKVIDLPHKLLVVGLNKTIETKKDSSSITTNIVTVKPSVWERLKSHIRFIEILAAIGGSLFLLWHFRKEILSLFV